MQYFNIRVASQLSGVASATIRAWEKRYNAVEPTRGENGHRLYSEIDIEKLALLFKLTEIGQSIGKIANLQLEELKKIYETVFNTSYNQKNLVSVKSTNIDYHQILNNLFLALSAYKLEILSHELEKAKNELTPRELSLYILLPLFYEVGVRVEKKQLTIAQERTISSLAIFYFGQVIGSHYKNFAKKNDLFVIATPEGEFHEIGILSAALLCVQYGHQFILLGPNIPAESLKETVNALKAKYILLGITRDDLKMNYTIHQFLNELRHDLHSDSKIIFGGVISQSLKSELSKQRISYFQSMIDFDEFLSKL
jgi:DNA-binding transcriptional MerR regulator